MDIRVLLLLGLQSSPWVMQLAIVSYLLPERDEFWQVDRQHFESQMISAMNALTAVGVDL